MLIKRLTPPLAPCHACGAEYVGSYCPICKAEHPSFTAIKNIAAKTRPTCRYYTSDPCDCGGLGHCLAAA